MDSAKAPNPAMPNPIALYLAQLELALAGQNPALVHDAIVDAESHLRAAVAAGADPARAVEDFGAPEDIARAYIAADARLPFVTPVSAGESFLPRARHLPIIGIWFHPHAWGSLLYFTTIGFVFAVIVFMWVVGMLALSFATLPVLLIGVVPLVLLLGSVRGLCLLDGQLCQFFLGVRMPRRTQPVYTFSGISIWQRLGCWLRDVRSWLSLAYLLGSFPVAVVLFTLFVCLVSSSAALMGMPIASLLGGATVNIEVDPGETVNILGMDLTRHSSGYIEIPFLLTLVFFLGGLLLATCTLWLARGLGWVYGHVVQAIQVARPRAVLVRPVDYAAASRPSGTHTS